MENKNIAPHVKRGQKVKTRGITGSDLSRLLKSYLKLIILIYFFLLNV